MKEYSSESQNLKIKKLQYARQNIYDYKYMVDNSKKFIDIP